MFSALKILKFWRVIRYCNAVVYLFGIRLVAFGGRVQDIYILCVLDQAHYGLMAILCIAVFNGI